MIHNVKITESKNRVIEEYWLMRGLKKTFNDCLKDVKKVIAERESGTEPTIDEIAQFLYDSKADFVSVEHNYRFEPDLPFA